MVHHPAPSLANASAFSVSAFSRLACAGMAVTLLWLAVAWALAS
jgi:hypothetical protein